MVTGAQLNAALANKGNFDLKADAE
jgi:hypothetical protein